MADFVAVPAEALEGYLASLKFERTVQREEVVYVRRSQRNPSVQVKVYTSVRVGQTMVRAAGRDAIRVCTVFDDGRGRSFGVGKFPPVMRVHSVKSVLVRTFQRIQEAVKRGNEWMDQNERRVASEWGDRLEEKAEYARIEREQEEAAFMSDPDIAGFVAAESAQEPPCDTVPSPPPDFEHEAYHFSVHDHTIDAEKILRSFGCAAAVSAA